MITIDLPPRQIAYFVPDVRTAAFRHHALFGSGPYFVSDHIPLSSAKHRGVDRELDHSSAYGQWGDVMVEFVQQNNAGPSPFHDVFPEHSGRQGMHHVALFVASIEAEMKRFNEAGFETALDARMDNGFRFAFIDTLAAFGHMIELYEPEEQLTSFYDLVANAAGDFSDGPIRSL